MDILFLLAESNETIADAEPIGSYSGFVTLAVVPAIFLTVQAVVCWLLSRVITAVPRDDRDLAPSGVWFLMIPCLHAVANFFIFPKVVSSLDRAFLSRGEDPFGDCGAATSKWYCIGTLVLIGLTWFRWLPFSGLLFVAVATVTSVLLILTLVRFWDLKGRLEQTQSATPAMPRKFDPKNPYA